MDKKEEILINEQEAVETKSSHKIKYTIAIISSTLVIAAITTLLIGHFKFDWFKSDNYKIDAHINRNIYQANYFSEKKTLNTKFTLPDGVTQQKEYIIDTNFVVYITDKTEKMNTAFLVFLSATIQGDDGLKNLPHLNIFDENEKKEVVANPDGSKYPIAKFRFDDDGEIEAIYLPDNMDEYHAEIILDLIEKVITKLARNKKEDMSKGLDIRTIKSKNKRIIVQTEAPKQYIEFKGSRYTRTVKTEIENDQIKNIKSDTDVYLQSQPEEGELIFGPKDMKFNMKSEITSNEEKYDEKENVETVKKLAEKFNFVHSKYLLNLIKEKKIEETKEEIPEETKPLRQLGFPISASRTIPIVTFNVLGQTVTIKYELSISSTKVVNKVTINSNLGTANFGNTGKSDVFTDSLTYNKKIFQFPVPGTANLISVGAYAKGSLKWGVQKESGSGSSSKYSAYIQGTLTLGAQAIAGVDKLATLTAYAEGTVFDAKGTAYLTSGSVNKGSLSVSLGKLVAGVKGKALFDLINVDFYKCTIYEGWKVV